MSILKSKIKDIIDRSKKQNKYRKYSKEEKEKINTDISEKMEESRLKYLRWESESIEEASNCIIDS